MATAPLSLNHVAYPTWNSAETHRFYTDVLGCKLLAAIRLDEVPSTGAKTPYLHTFYGLETGEAIAFFEVEGLGRPADDGVPDWIRHIALNVGSMGALLEWKERLEAKGVQVTGVIDHAGVWESLYFFDPNGVRLELTYQTQPLTESDATSAVAQLKAWIEGRSAS